MRIHVTVVKNKKQVNAHSHIEKRDMIRSSSHDEMCCGWNEMTVQRSLNQ